MGRSSRIMAFGQPGAFPRTELEAGESLIFEGKPSLVAMCLPGIIWLVMCLGGALTVAAFLAAIPLCAASSVLAGVLIGIVPFLYFYVRWSGTSFAMTDRRVMVHRTDSSLHRLSQSLPLGQVTATVRSQSFTDGLFGAGDISFSAAAGAPGLTWPSVPGHDTVRPFVDQELNRLKRPVAPPPGFATPAQQYMGYVMAPPVQETVMAPPPGRPPLQIPARRCPSCGMNFSGDAAFCPYCGAQA